MARQMCWAFVGSLVLGSGSLAAAEVCTQQAPQQGQKAGARDERRDVREPFENHPRYPWWKDDKAIAAATITPEQAAQIDQILRSSWEKSRPLREEVMQLQKAMNQTIEANIAEVAFFAKQVDKIETKRAELNKLRLVMLYSMHRVLSPEQNARLTAYFEKREAERRKQDGDRRH